MWSFVGSNSVWQDFVLAVRGLRTPRGPFTLAGGQITLALGIGANTAVFSLVNSLLLRPLPVSHPEQLVLVSQPSHDDLLSFMFNHPMWAQIRQRAASLRWRVWPLLLAVQPGLWR